MVNLKHNICALAKDLLVTVMLVTFLSQTASFTQAAENGSYSLSDFGDITTAIKAEETYQKAAKEILAKGGGVLMIPPNAPKDWNVVNTFQQERDDGPVLTVIDRRSGYNNFLVPSIGKIAPLGWAGQRITREINQSGRSLPFQGSTNVQEIRSLVPHGSSSYMQYVSDNVSPGQDQRVYVPTMRGLYVGQFLSLTGGAYSYAQPYDQFYVKDLGWDKERNMPYVVGDFKNPHPKNAILYNKHVTGIMQLENSTQANNQTMDFQVTRRQYAQGDAFMISAMMFNQGDVFSGLGDECACIFNCESVYDVQAFHSTVESVDSSKNEVIFKANSTENPEKLASCRPLINLNQNKWITKGHVKIVAPDDWAGMFIDDKVLDSDRFAVSMEKLRSYRGEKPPITTWMLQPVKSLKNVYHGKAYPSVLRDSLNYLGGRILGSPDCGWTGEVVGRFFAVADPSECITPKDPAAGYAMSDPKRNVYRWYMIREFSENPDGTKSIKIERIRWAAVNAGAPVLFDRDNYTRDGHEKQLSYIIAPGAFVTNVGQGWVDRTYVTVNDPRRIQIAPSPDKGTRFDFEPIDPIELAIGADPANPTGYRMRFHNQLPSTLDDSGIALINYSRCAMDSAVGIGGSASRLEDLQQQKDKQPNYLAGIRVSSATVSGISFEGDTVNEAILFKQPNNRAQPIRWLHHGKNEATTLTVKPDTGDMEIMGGSLSLSKGSLQKTGGISATGVSARNLRGINVRTKTGMKRMEVLFNYVEPDATYSLTVQSSWMTLACVSQKTAKGFVVEFSVPAPQEATFDWQLIR